VNPIHCKILGTPMATLYLWFISTSATN